MNDIDDKVHSRLAADGRLWRSRHDASAPIEPPALPTRSTRHARMLTIAASVVAVLAVAAVAGVLLSRKSTSSDDSHNLAQTTTQSGTSVPIASCVQHLELVDAQIVGASGDHPLPEINYAFRYNGNVPCKIGTFDTTAELQAADGATIGTARDVSLVGGPTHLVLTNGSRIEVAIGWRVACSDSENVASIVLRFDPAANSPGQVLRVPDQYNPQCVADRNTSGWIEPIRRVE
jgi:hypothetical protein